MPIEVTDDQDSQVSIHARSEGPRVLRRDTNTIVLQLNDDEILKLIADLAGSSWGGSAYLVIEADYITHPKEIA